MQRFAVNPRAFVVQAVSLVEILLRTVFNLFNYFTQLTDNDNNNDIPAITNFVRGKWLPDTSTWFRKMTTSAHCQGQNYH